MSQAEGYELFMCPECEYNIYEPGPACPNCGYSVMGSRSPRTPQTPNTLRRHPSKTPTLLEIARRDNRRRVARPTMLLIHSMPTPNGRPYDRWAVRIKVLLSRIAQHPFTLSNHKTQSSLLKIFNLLERRLPDDAALEELFNTCDALINDVTAQRPTPISAPVPTNPGRHQSKLNRPPHGPYTTSKPKTLPAEYTLSLPERRTLKSLEKALQTLASFNRTGQRNDEPHGALLAQLPLPATQEPQDARTRIDQHLAGHVTWVTSWRTDNAQGHKRTFRMHETNYTLILDYTTRNAFYIELKEPTNP